MTAAAARLCARVLPYLQSETAKSKIENTIARVAELADAPDLGFRNHRLQNVSSRFKKQSIYEGKTHFVTPEVVFTNDEQKSARSSTKLVHRRARLRFMRVHKTRKSVGA